MKSYLRFLSRNKLYTAIELVGLSISLAFVILTTGATLEACASIQVEQLGCRVSIATLAYVE